MAFNRKPLNLSGEFNVLQKGTLIKCFEQLASGTGSLVPQTAPVALTDNTGGTANNTLVAIPATTPADLAAQGVINGNVRDNLADLAGKINALRTALIASGIMT